MKKVFIPLVLFFRLVIFLALGLNRDPREIPSPLIGKPAPAFSLDRKSTRLNSSHMSESRMPSSA